MSDSIQPSALYRQIRSIQTTTKEIKGKLNYKKEV